MLKFYKNIILRKKSYLGVLLMVLFGVGVYGDVAAADGLMGKAASAAGTLIEIGLRPVYMLFGGIMNVVILVVGVLLNVAVMATLIIARYDNFVNEYVVDIAWGQVRDFSNMFFILILLVIAFATILRVESYNVKRQLPKLIMMAVLINFSKTICGIIIEFAQIVMMTFMNVIDMNGAGIINLFGVGEFLSAARKDSFTEWDLNLLSSSAGLFLGLIFLVVTLVTLLAYMSVLLMRMIMLWIYVILSPLAYLLAAFPQGQSYASKWWSEFTKYVITGPLLAFFLWLALISAKAIPTSLTAQKSCYGPGEMVCTDNFLHFLVAIGMLIGGLKITSEVGGTVGSAAGNALSNIKSGQMFGPKTRAITGWGARKVASHTGVELRPSQIIGGIKESFKERENKDNAQARAKAGTLLESGGIRSLAGALGAGSDGANAFLSGYGGLKGAGNALRAFRNDPKKIKTARKEWEDNHERIEGQISNLKEEPESIDRQRAIAAKKKELKTLKDNVTNIIPPTAFEGRTAERTLINEEKKKAAEFNTSEELLTHYKKSIASGDKYRAVAIAEQLADNGDLNELLGEYGHSSDAKGLHNFVQNEFVGEQKYGKQEALRFQNYLSNGAQKSGHWELAKTVGVNVDGSLKSLIKEEKNGELDDSAHVNAAWGDVSKHDPQAVAKMGRLAFGGEDENGNYQVSNLGKMIMQNMGHAFKDHEKRVQTNTAKSITSSKAYQKDGGKELFESYKNKTDDKDKNVREGIIGAMNKQAGK